MLTRREVLVGAVVAGVAALDPYGNSLAAKASQPRTPVKLDVPQGACDCHTHIFGDPQRYKFAAGRAYTPEPASIDEMRSLHRALHIDRVVIVQPSIYGTDNSCTLDAIKQLGPRARGVAVIDDKTTDAALDDMMRNGIKGIRVNLETAGQTDPALARQHFQSAVARTKGRNLHIQVYTRLSVIEAIKDQVAASPVPVVFDHFGGAQGPGGVQQAGFPTLLNLVKTGKAYVKISAPYRSSTQTPAFADVVPLAKALIAANLQRMVWGSDWPHPDSSQVPGRKPTDIAPLYQIDDGNSLNLLAVWAPDAAQREAILVSNPARLYGY
jgi:predicted TIM-barrel fold metal-dependent hydrolase